ncbi:MAG: hypothetical protein ACOCZS_02940 [Verrucomicrobiota bacterium]
MSVTFISAMPRQTLTSSWNRFERLIRKYVKSDGKDPEALKALEDFTEKLNSSQVVKALATVFVYPYGFDDVNIRFTVRENEGVPDWKIRFQEEKREIEINPVGVFYFIKECRQAVAALQTPAARRNFTTYRLQAYLAELSKLPSTLLLTLLILYEIASINHITDVKQKSGEVETAEGEEYLKLLWAFKELETYYYSQHGRELRTEYGISWLESDWFIGE